MRSSLLVVVLAVASLLAPSVAAAQTACANSKTALGVERIVEIDTSTGALYGENTKLAREDSFLGPKEVVLTFDDGPLSWITTSILKDLDTFCTKATFFSVGQMALAYPDLVKEVLARGHTLGGHTWSHPMNVPRLSYEKATDQIERGFAAIALAAGQPIAPFFRFPGLSDSDPLLAYLQSRGVATFTVDVISNDSYIASAARLTQRTLAEVERRNGGIILFHDIKASTAHALPDILAGLKQRGFKVVHMRAKAPFTPLPEMTAQLQPAYEKAQARANGGKADAPAQLAVSDGKSVHQLMPEPPSQSSDVGATGSTSVASSEIPVTQIAPPARTRVAALDPTKPTASERRKRQAQVSDDDDDRDGLDRVVKPPRQKAKFKVNRKVPAPTASASSGGSFLFPF